MSGVGVSELPSSRVQEQMMQSYFQTGKTPIRLDSDQEDRGSHYYKELETNSSRDRIVM